MNAIGEYTKEENQLFGRETTHPMGRIYEVHILRHIGSQAQFVECET